MQSPTWSRAQPPLLEHFTTNAHRDAASPATATSSNGPASHPHLPPPTQPANAQDGSLFFTRLPSEIRRMIYIEIWRTFGTDGYEDDNGQGQGERGDGTPHQGSTARGGLSPHITAAMTPSKLWMTDPLPGSSGSRRSDGGGDVPPQQQQQQQQTAAVSSPPWTRQIRGFTSAPCFLAVDGEDEDSSEGGRKTTATRARRPPEADDVRPARLAAAHTADLDAAATSNSNSIWQGEPEQGINNLEATAIGIARPSANQDSSSSSSSTWRARWNSPWLGHWACEEYYSGAATSRSSMGPESAAAEVAAAAAAAAGSSVRSEDHRRRRRPLRRPYLPILLTCRRAYVEGIDLLYGALTFQFTEMATAEGFLARWPCVASVRLVMHLSTSLLDFYRHADNGGADQGIITAGASMSTSSVVVPNENNGGLLVGPGAVTIGTFPRHDDERGRGLGDNDGAEGRGTVRGTVVNARNNQWQRLCAGLSPDHLPNLRRLHVWVEAHDLRGWHKAAAETRLFAKLLEAGGGDGGGGILNAEGAAPRRRLTADNFVLYLPTLPADAKTHGLPGCYLAVGDESSKDEDDDRDREALPCTIVRTERPDYWDVHLNMRPVFVNRRMSIGSRVAALRRAGFL
ncbi:hypothetical protein SCUCBS95973_004051 [Sporothrix curviconia]|uniref:Uncharacterized protein n=1 Tax=Sporothrix curviconia TaxID=1260050 RepID=A0ABP0BKS4_9PEZI